MSRHELYSISRHAGHNFHEIFHLRQGVHSDMPTYKILEMMKSTNLDNAPTQSLLTFVNGILDEIIENKNGEIPYHIACLLRKVILEIERRISTQAEHIRNQNKLMRAREEKYKSRIKVLEALASGISGQTQIHSSETIGKANVRCNISSSLCLRPDMNNISLSYSFLIFLQVAADHVVKVCFLLKNWLFIHITILYISLIEILLLFALEFCIFKFCKRAKHC